ncbi:hypothetical protein GQ42DRAFT_170336 [Ramicandelaber brevisporus]|nr:hypothetical protein GQ42DRAFT_170336 [Ramicandelaber brevisporus]
MRFHVTGICAVAAATGSFVAAAPAGLPLPGGLLPTQAAGSLLPAQAAGGLLPTQAAGSLLPTQGAGGSGVNPLKAVPTDFKQADTLKTLTGGLSSIPGLDHIASASGASSSLPILKRRGFPNPSDMIAGQVQKVQSQIEPIAISFTNMALAFFGNMVEKMAKPTGPFALDQKVTPLEFMDGVRNFISTKPLEGVTQLVAENLANNEVLRTVLSQVPMDKVPSPAALAQEAATQEPEL